MSIPSDSSEEMGISSRAPESQEKNFFDKLAKLEFQDAKVKNDLNSSKIKEESFPSSKLQNKNLPKAPLSFDSQNESSLPSHVFKKSKGKKTNGVKWQVMQDKFVNSKSPQIEDLKKREDSRIKLNDGVDDHYHYFLGDLSHVAKPSKDELIFKYMPTIQPDSGLKIIWNIFTCLCIVVQCFFISIELFFDSNWFAVDSKMEYFAFYIGETLKYCLLLDAVFNSMTGYYYQGDLIMDKRKILIHFIKKLILIDILVILPIFFDFDASSERQGAFYNSKLSIIKLLFLLRIFKLNRTFQSIEYIISNNEKMEGLISLLKLILKIIFMAHMFACFWYLIGDFSMRNGYPNWKSSFLMIYSNDDWRTFYIHSLYWSITTMITVGYGDITPVNNAEICFVIISMIFGCGLFGYSLSNIGKIFDKIFTKETQLRMKLSIINRYMRRKNINFQLQGKVRRYLTFILKESFQENSQLEHELIGKLSTSLKKELLLQANGHLLTRTPLFANNFSPKVIQKLTEILEPLDLAPDEFVYEEGEGDADKIFFVVKGKLMISLKGGYDKTRERSTVFKTLREGDVFGEYSFFSGKKREMSVITNEYTRLYFISRSKFIEVLQKENADYEAYCQMKDMILLYNDRSLLHSRCFACAETDHDIAGCELLSVKSRSRRQEVIQTYLRNKTFKRINFSRRKSRSRNPLLQLDSLNKLKENLEENYDFEDYESDLNRLRTELLDPDNIVFNMNESEAEWNIGRSKSSQDTFKEPKEYNYSLLKENPKAGSPSMHLILDSKNSNYRKSKSFNDSKLNSSEKLSPDAEPKMSHFGATARMSFKKTSSADSAHPPRHGLKKITPLPRNLIQGEIDFNQNDSVINHSAENKAPLKINIFDMSFDVGSNFGNYFPGNNKFNVLRKMTKDRLKSESSIRKSKRLKATQVIADSGRGLISSRRNLLEFFKI